MWDGDNVGDVGSGSWIKSLVFKPRYEHNWNSSGVKCCITRWLHRQYFDAVDRLYTRHW